MVLDQLVLLNTIAVFTLLPCIVLFVAFVKVDKPRCTEIFHLSMQRDSILKWYCNRKRT